MNIHRIAALAAFVVAAASSHAAAAETCGLGLMASFDMTNLPDGRFTIPASLNGATERLLVDTGGAFTKLHPSVSTKLNLHESQTYMEIYGVAGKLHVRAATVDSFKLGEVEAKRFHVAVTDDDSDPAAGVDGVLAPDMLSLFDVELDFAKGKMNLFSQDHCPGKVVYWTRGSFAELPFRMVSGPISLAHWISLTTTLDGHELESVFDTGSAATWLRHKTAVREFGFDETAQGVEISPRKVQGLTLYRKRFGTLHLGGVDAPNPNIDVVPDQYQVAFNQQHSEKSRDDPIYGSNLPSFDFSVGMDVIRKLHVFISYKERKVYATAADAH